jgi:hypothetical protein
LDAVAKNPPSMEVMSTWQWSKIGEQIQEHVDYLNQSHEAKVKRIDEEYHSFMEKVRNVIGGVWGYEYKYLCVCVCVCVCV